MLSVNEKAHGERQKLLKQDLVAYNTKRDVLEDNLQERGTLAEWYKNIQTQQNLDASKTLDEATRHSALLQQERKTLQDERNTRSAASDRLLAELRNRVVSAEAAKAKAEQEKASVQTRALMLREQAQKNAETKASLTQVRGGLEMCTSYLERLANHVTTEFGSTAKRNEDKLREIETLQTALEQKEAESAAKEKEEELAKEQQEAATAQDDLREMAESERERILAMVRDAVAGLKPGATTADMQAMGINVERRNLELTQLTIDSLESLPKAFVEAIVKAQPHVFSIKAWEDKTRSLKSDLGKEVRVVGAQQADAIRKAVDQIVGLRDETKDLQRAQSAQLTSEHLAETRTTMLRVEGNINSAILTLQSSLRDTEATITGAVSAVGAKSTA